MIKGAAPGLVGGNNSVSEMTMLCAFTEVVIVMVIVPAHEAGVKHLRQEAVGGIGVDFGNSCPDARGIPRFCGQRFCDGVFTDAGDDAGNAADQGDIGLGGVENGIGTGAVVDQGAKMQGCGGKVDVAVIGWTEAAGGCLAGAAERGRRSRMPSAHGKTQRKASTFPSSLQ